MQRCLVVIALCALASACGRTPAPGEAGRPDATLAQMMRGIPFPSSNIIFDAQSQDPGRPATAQAGNGATAAFASVYGGWQAVENSALALSETATLLMVPGRMCENGRPAPLDRADFRQFSEGLAAAGRAAYQAARAKDLDAIVEASGTVSDACAACHEVYRDKDDPQDRCM